MRSVYVRPAGVWVALAWVLAAGTPARAQAPEQTTVCQIKSNLTAFDHKAVQLTAFAIRGSEKFVLFDPGCQSWPEIWLEYGGPTASGTAYCCDVAGVRKHGKPVELDGLSIPLVDDKPFHEFDRLIRKPPESIVHATLNGTFFAAGHNTTASGATGYGQVGCCSLLMIRQVMAVDPQTRTDVDYRSSPDQPTAVNNGCEVKIVLEEASKDGIAAQQQAEVGPRAWSFDDPVRVGTDALTGLLKLDPAAAVTMTQLRKMAGRDIYEWKPGGKKESYTVVVHKPYWLSFYAKDAQKVAWVVMAIYESSCK